MDAAKCQWCLDDSPLTHAHRDCCRLRWYAKAPNIQLINAVKGLTRAEKEELRTLIPAERKRLKEIRNNRTTTLF